MTVMPRRKAGTLVPIEVEILHAALASQRAGTRYFHGFGLAQAMSDDAGARLIGHGTLYKALGRLEEMGLLVSHWEDDPPQGRPRRRQYELTAPGLDAAVASPSEAEHTEVRRRLAPGTT